MYNDKSIGMTSRKPSGVDLKEEVKKVNALHQLKAEHDALLEAKNFNRKKYMSLKIFNDRIEQEKYIAEVQAEYMAANRKFDEAAEIEALNRYNTYKKKTQAQIEAEIDNKKLKEQIAYHSRERALQAEALENQKALYKAQAEDSNLSLKERATAAKDYAMQDALEGFEKSVNNFVNGLEAFNSDIKKYGEYQSRINTRIQGGDLDFNKLERTMTIKVGLNPYFTTESLMDNILKVSESGILFNIEQRSFLETISSKIAATFEATNGTLLRIIRLQQADSTAARLGMEASMTSWLNSMYQNTEYLINSFDNVTSNLTEAISQMTVDQSIQFEYMVQKWLGSLESLGMSSGTVQNIASAIGYLGSGDITSLSSNSQMQNLIVMAATQAGLSYSDMLINGLDSKTTNKLLQSIVEYLQEISSTDNKVVKSQYGEIFGVTLSDLAAVNNLTQQDIKLISQNSMNYASAIGELEKQMGQLAKRTGLAEMIQNLLSSAKWGLASGIADDPVSAAMWEITGMIQTFTGGINIPAISVMGSGIDLNTTVENLMRLGLVGINSLSMIGDVISGIGSTFAPKSMLTKLGITQSKLATTSRGYGLQQQVAGITQANVTTVGNSSGDDLYESTVNSASSDSNKTMEKQKKEEQDKMSKTSSVIIGYETEGNFKQLANLQETLSSIYTLVKRLIEGDVILKVNADVETLPDQLYNNLNKIDYRTGGII